MVTSVWFSLDVTRQCSRQSRARVGRGASLRRSPLRSDSPAVLGRMAHRGTHCVRFAHSVQTATVSQILKRASRAAMRPALLGAAEARRGPPGHGFAAVVLVSASNTQHVPSSRRAVSALGDFGGAEERSSKAGARSALQHLTHRSCLNGVSEANAVSSAVRPWSEHRREVGAQRRPPTYEPRADTARRDDASTPHATSPLQRTSP